MAKFVLVDDRAVGYHDYRAVGLDGLFADCVLVVSMMMMMNYCLLMALRTRV